MADVILEDSGMSIEEETKRRNTMDSVDQFLEDNPSVEELLEEKEKVEKKARRANKLQKPMNYLDTLFRPSMKLYGKFLDPESNKGDKFQRMMFDTLPAAMATDAFYRHVLNQSIELDGLALGILAYLTAGEIVQRKASDINEIADEIGTMYSDADKYALREVFGDVSIYGEADDRADEINSILEEAEYFEFREEGTERARGGEVEEAVSELERLQEDGYLTYIERSETTDEGGNILDLEILVKWDHFPLDENYTISEMPGEATRYRLTAYLPETESGEYSRGVAGSRATSDEVEVARDFLEGQSGQDSEEGKTEKLKEKIPAR